MSKTPLTSEQGKQVVVVLGIARLLSGEQVAAILGIKPQSLRIRRMRGQGPPFIRLNDSPNSRVFYREDDLNAFVNARPRYSGTAEEKRALHAKAAAGGS